MGGRGKQRIEEQSRRKERARTREKCFRDYTKKKNKEHRSTQNLSLFFTEFVLLILLFREEIICSDLFPPIREASLHLFLLHSPLD